MITLQKIGDAIKFTFSGNTHYLQDGTIEVPVNSLSLTIDGSEMVTFKKSASNDIFLSATYGELGMTKDELVAWYKENMVDGGGSDITIDPSLDSGSTNPVANSAITTAINEKADKSTAGAGLNVTTTNNHEIVQLKNQNGDYITGYYNQIGFAKINNRQIVKQGTVSYENFSLVDTSAITTSVTSGSTDSEIPSAKAVYDALQEGGGNNVVELTQAEYDALVSGGTVDPTAFYIITDAVAFDPSTKVDTSAFTAYSAATDATLSGKVDTSAITTSVTSASTDSEIPTAKAVYEATQSGGGGKAIEAGRGISVTTGATADTVSISLPISAGTDNYSIQEGFETYANGNGYAAHAEGYKTSAMTYSCHAEGRGTKASGDNSHAEGRSTTASGDNSHAEGQSTIASGTDSHAEGAYTSASSVSNVSGINVYSGYQARHAEGCNTLANNASTHAEGYYTQANNFGEHASGVYNVSNSATITYGDSGNTLFSVGNGTADNARHNAFEIRQNGDIYLTKDGQDVKLQDQLGGGEVSSAITSGDTNAVAGGAVYDKFDEVEQVTAVALNALNDKFGGLSLVKLTQSEYNALSPNYDNNTLYVIV